MEFANNDLWFKDPDFIRKPKEFWPEDISADIKELPPDAIVEERTVTNLIAETKMCLRVSLEQIIDLHRYSSYEKLLRVTSYVNRFASKLYAKVTKSQLVFPETLAVETEEVANAEKLWIQSVQSFYFEGSKYDQLKTQLGVFLTEENILRCKGRLKHSSLPYSQKFPALLPSDSRLTELIILQYHSRVFHNKTLETLNQLRSRFWVPRDRQVVRKIIYRCFVCRKIEGKPFTSPVSAPLPEFRLSSEVSAFQSV